MICVSLPHKKLITESLIVQRFCVDTYKMPFNKKRKTCNISRRMFLKLICYTYCIFQKVVVLELPQEMKVYIKKNIYLNTYMIKFYRFEGSAILSQQKGKPILVQVVVLSDLVFFLLENNQKYYFFSPDSKVSICFVFFINCYLIRHW